MKHGIRMRIGSSVFAILTVLLTGIVVFTAGRSESLSATVSVMALLSLVVFFVGEMRKSSSQSGLHLVPRQAAIRVVSVSRKGKL